MELRRSRSWHDPGKYSNSSQSSSNDLTPADFCRSDPNAEKIFHNGISKNPCRTSGERIELSYALL